MSQAYSSVSLPTGKPATENIAWALICNPERLRCPSLNTASTAGRYTHTEINYTKQKHHENFKYQHLREYEQGHLLPLPPDSYHWQTHVEAREQAVAWSPYNPFSSQNTGAPGSLQDPLGHHCYSAVKKEQIRFTTTLMIPEGKYQCLQGIKRVGSQSRLQIC